MPEGKKVRQRPTEPVSRWNVPPDPRVVFRFGGLALAMIATLSFGDLWFFLAAVIVWLFLFDTGEQVGS